MIAVEMVLRSALIWLALAAAIVVPLAAAAFSDQLAWRHPIYIAAGFAGVLSLGLLLVQPLLIGRYLPALSPQRARQLHRLVGAVLVLMVVIHVGGLWITSPPDVIDALLFASPTPFSIWGVIAMWAVFGAALLAAFRRRLRLRLTTWRTLHLAFAAVIASGGVVHALLIEGTMEALSKIALCICVSAAMIKVMVDFFGRSR